MIEVTAILAAAAIVYGLARATKIPEIPLLIVAGAAMASVGHLPEFELLGWVVTTPELLADREFVIGLLEIGLIFLVFSAGIDMSPSRVGRQKGLALQVGLVQFIALGVVTLWLALRTGYGLQEALFVGLAVSASSTLVVVRQLKVRREMFEPFGRMILGVLLLQDLLVIGGLILLTVVFQGNAGEMLLPLETTAGLLVATIVLAKWVMPRVVRRYRDDDETLLLFILGTLFAFVAVAYLGDVPIVIAAFFAGLALSAFPCRSLVRGLLTSLTDFFMVVFFISLGALLQIPSGETVIEGLILIVAVLIITPLLVAYAAERAGMTSRGALESGLLIAQTSEFSIVVALLGLELGVLDHDLFALIVLVTVVTMMITPLWSSQRFVRWLMQWHPSPGPKTRVPERSGHVVVVGAGTAGQLLIEKLRGAGVDIVIVDSDPNVVRRFREQGIDAVWGDADEKNTLEEAGVGSARVVVVTTGDLHHLQAVRRLATDDALLWLHAFEENDAETAQMMGAQTITYSRAAADSFMEWFGEEFENR